MELGQLIRTRRDALGWSLETLAKHADVSASTISRLENGRTGGRPHEISRIVRALGIDPATFGETLIQTEQPRPPSSPYVDLIVRKLAGRSEATQRAIYHMLCTLPGDDDSGVRALAPIREPVLIGA